MQHEGLHPTGKPPPRTGAADAAARAHPKAIQTRLGHATITETMDTYGHLFPDADEQGRGAIDAMFATPLDAVVVHGTI